MSVKIYCDQIEAEKKNNLMVRREDQRAVLTRAVVN